MVGYHKYCSINNITLNWQAEWCRSASLIALFMSSRASTIAAY